MSERVKVFFSLEQDEDGYPGVSAESIWAKATEVPDEYTVDNVPFFAREATLGDTLKVHHIDGALWFDHLVHRSGNSLIRIVFFNRDSLARIDQALSDMGCLNEYSKDFNLLAVSVPASTSLAEVEEYLIDQASRGDIDYEEPILRQD